MTVVMLESRIVVRALLNPEVSAALGVLPARVSSLMRSKIRMLLSTAMPMVRMMPAMPGSVSVALNAISSAKSTSSVVHSDRSAVTPHRR